MTKSHSEENLGQTLWHFLPGILKFLSVLGIGLAIFNLVGISLRSGTADNLAEITKTSNIFVRNYDPVLGKADSNLKLIYFIDYQCPVCASNADNMKQLKTEYKDKIQFVYKNYPIPNAHVYAEPAAKAVLAANMQGKGFELGDLMLARQTDGFSTAKFAEWAKELGLNIDKFNEDRGSSTVRRQVQIDQADYDTADLPKSTISGQPKAKGETGGTPTTILVKGNKVIDWWSGKADIQQVKGKLDEYLK